MAKSTTTVSFEEPINQMLRLYMKASGMNLSVIVARATEAYIKYELDHNDGLRAKYEAERAQILASAGPNVSMIMRRKRTKEATASAKADLGKELQGQQ